MANVGRRSCVSSDIGWREYSWRRITEEIRLVTNLMAIFDLISELGWEQAFQKQFKLTVEEFYLELEKFVAETHVPIDRPCEKKVGVGF